MNIKVLRAKIDLSQRAFGERICVKAQTIQKYESGERNIPDSIQKLIRYEFAEFLPEEERLIPGAQPHVSDNKMVSIEEYEKVVDERKKLLEGAKNVEKIIYMQDKTISVLEDQVQLYKEHIKIKGGSNSQQTG